MTDPSTHSAANDTGGLRPDAQLDARGVLCPLPVLKARKRLMSLDPGALLEVLADDPAAVIDMPHFCAEAGHELVESGAAEGDAMRYLIRKHGG